MQRVIGHWIMILSKCFLSLLEYCNFFLITNICQTLLHFNVERLALVISFCLTLALQLALMGTKLEGAPAARAPQHEQESCSCSSLYSCNSCYIWNLQKQALFTPWSYEYIVYKTFCPRDSTPNSFMIQHSMIQYTHAELLKVQSSNSV